MYPKLLYALLCLFILVVHPTTGRAAAANESTAASGASASQSDKPSPRETLSPLAGAPDQPRRTSDEARILREAKSAANGKAPSQPPQLLSPEEILRHPNSTRQMLGTELPPATSSRLVWKPSQTFSGMAVDTPVLVVNGAYDGPTLCLTAAIHGDELNGIEMVRRLVYELDPGKLGGMVVGVPIVNLLGFSRNSRYLPDRRDLNRFFPGNPRGSVASRIADAFFNDVVKHCDRLVDLHTGSFYRTNIPQLRADMDNPRVADFVELFGDIPVLNSRGNSRSLRAAAVRAGIPTVTLEAGEPMRLQRDMVQAGVAAIMTLMAKSRMYPKLDLWGNPAPAFYNSAWLRANASGIFFSGKELGAEVEKGEKVGVISNPISNEQVEIFSPHNGRILGMALDQFVMPGFAVFHIGIHAAKGAQEYSLSEEEDDLGEVDYEGEQAAPGKAAKGSGSSAAPEEAEDNFGDE